MCCCPAGWSQEACCEQQGAARPDFTPFQPHTQVQTHTRTGTPSSSYTKVIWAWSPDRAAKGPAEAIWATSHLCAKGVQSDLSRLERKVTLKSVFWERGYLPTLASKEVLSQGLLSWEHGLRKIKYSHSLSTDGPQEHLFFKDLSVILCLHVATQSRYCAISFLQLGSRTTGMACSLRLLR